MASVARPAVAPSNATFKDKENHKKFVKPTFLLLELYQMQFVHPWDLKGWTK